MTLNFAIDLWCKVWGSLAAFAIVFPIGLIVTAYVAGVIRGAWIFAISENEKEAR